MPVTTVYVDVDQTLIDIKGRLLPKVKSGLKLLKRHHYTVVVWSRTGTKHIKKVLKKHKLLKFVDFIMNKPDIIIDDVPEGIVSSTNVCKINPKHGWIDIGEMIYHKEVV